MPRYFMQLAYAGKGYAGWQRQINAYTLQEAVEKSLSILTNRPVEVVASGRTDAGVHAACQVAHFDLDDSAITNRFAYRLNRMLPEQIACVWVQEVVPDAHARFSAINREYSYRMMAGKDPFRNAHVARVWPVPNMEAMNEAAKILLGEHVFRSFAKHMPEERHYKCKIYKCEWQRVGDEMVMTINADRFLRGMVRAIVGAMIVVGQGKKQVCWMKEILDGQHKIISAALAPSEGLHLSHVAYRDDIWLGERMSA